MGRLRARPKDHEFASINGNAKADLTIAKRFLSRLVNREKPDPRLVKGIAEMRMNLEKRYPSGEGLP